ncbi:ABC transporter ATP-binding protein [Anaerosalibacter massiliensis]|uniref:ABC transporter ATP-binding protein n=1 Tax=Anaerosalibacter massiliensis TaxID=1347392 RepID=A0A9X2S4L8_9FIRM|nr:ABC transporter ATP-binding protein [Anaerosalibacter massiliensis]MCR2043618.1 ABC transporter ATP-binding protein [Anaerosalibacter massiliensis]
MKKLLTLDKVSKIYDGKISYKALNNINLTIDEGEFVGIMGPSGSGKTTLLNIISTIDTPTSGEVILNEKKPHHLNKEELAFFRRRELGFVFQDFNLLDTLTIGENIVLPLTLDGVEVSDMDKKLEEVAGKLGIGKILNKRTYEVSGGQAQRAAVARAIISSPSLLLADEPTGNLDSKAAKDVMELFYKINKNDKVTTLMVTHDAYTASYCDRVIFIKDGELYNELHQGDNKKLFYQEIMDLLSMLGGGRNDF